MSSPVVERLFVAVTSDVTELVKSLYEVLSKVKGFQGMFWGANIELHSKIEILISNTYP